jgi:hypothetical protein
MYFLQQEEEIICCLFADTGLVVEALFIPLTGTDNN